MSLNNIYVRSACTRASCSTGRRERASVGRVDFTVDEHVQAARASASWRLTAASDRLRLCDVVDGRAGRRASRCRPRPARRRTHWEQLYFPLLSPLEAKAGETVAIELRSRTSIEGGTHVAWTATQLNAKGGKLARQALNLDKGFLP